MTISKKALDRRTVLRGIGTTIALPLLDAMIPAMTATASTPAAAERLRRIGYVYIPMGFNPTEWTPGDDELDTLPSSLQSLSTVKDDITS